VKAWKETLVNLKPEQCLVSILLIKRVTVHGFRVQRFRVHLKPACHPSSRFELLIRELGGENA
jgi:hypothetical protein